MVQSVYCSCRRSQHAGNTSVSQQRSCFSSRHPQPRARVCVFDTHRHLLLVACGHAVSYIKPKYHYSRITSVTKLVSHTQLANRVLTFFSIPIPSKLRCFFFRLPFFFKNRSATTRFWVHVPWLGMPTRPASCSGS